MSVDDAPPSIGLVLAEDLADDTAPDEAAPPTRVVDAWLAANPTPPEEPAPHPDEGLRALREGRPAPGPPVLSPSRWKLLRSCPLRYRFAATLGIPEWPDGETALGLWGAPRAGAAPGRDAGPTPPERPWRRPGAGRIRGTVVHRLLERGLADRADLAREVDAALGEQDVPPDPAFRDWVVEEAARALDRVASSPWGAALQRATRAARERSFVLPLGPGTVEGTIDALFRAEDGVWCVVDWKTDALRPEVDLDQAVRHRGYDAQLDLYALAAATLLGLGPEREEAPETRVRAALFFTARGEAWEQTYDRARLADVARRASADLAILATGTPLLPPTPPCPTCGFFGGEEDTEGVLPTRREGGGRQPVGGDAVPWGRFGRGAGICPGPDRAPGTAPL